MKIEVMPLMKCGHTANGITTNNMPICAICNCFEVANTPDLKNRMAKCIDCDKKRPSDEKLPFFQYCPEMEYDSFYCGCVGWD